MAKSTKLGRGIYKRGNIFWLAVQQNGKRQFITLETDDPVEAMKRATQIRESPDLNESAPLMKEIERFIEYKLRMNIYTRSTAMSKKNVLKLFADSLPQHANTASISTKQIQNFYDNVRKRCTDTSAAGYVMALRSFFRWAVEKARIVRRNPVEGIVVAKSKGRARENFCDYELRDKLIYECPDENLKFILFCGFHAGLRFQEIVEARPFWFDRPAGLLHLRKTATMNFKDREERTVPLTLQFRGFLDEYGMREPYMLKPQIKPGRAIYRYDFRKPFMDYMRAQSCAWVTPHIMRHTFASLLVSAGESIYKVAVWMGDDVATVQKHYGHLMPDNDGIEKAFSMRPVHTGSSGYSPRSSRSQQTSKSTRL